VVIRALVEERPHRRHVPDDYRPDHCGRIWRANAPDGEVIFRVAKPIMPDGGVAVLKGNLCPDGAVIKVAGLKNLVFEGTARVFENEGDVCRSCSQPSILGGRGPGDPQ
jgi:dihydroxyacid dehydratase/phosphogluconate dehydratase